MVLLGCYYIINRFLVTDTQRKQLAILGENTKENTRLRLQAYERLVLFIERIHPNSLISRHYISGATARDLHLAFLQSIRTEYEYNLSQQIYVSREVWQTVKTVKEQETAMINQIAASLAEQATAADLVSLLHNAILEDKESKMPTEVALEIINDEAKRILMQ